MLLLHSFSNPCAWIIASSCLVRISSILLSREQIFEMDSLSFCMVLVSSLVVVMELVPFELEATDAHVRLVDTSEFQVLVLDVSEKELTHLVAYCSSGSSALLNRMVRLKRTSGWKSGGQSSWACLHTSLHSLERLSCSHLVVDWKFGNLVYMFQRPRSVVLDVARTSRISFLFMSSGCIVDIMSAVIP